MGGGLGARDKVWVGQTRNRVKGSGCVGVRFLTHASDPKVSMHGVNARVKLARVMED